MKRFILAVVFCICAPIFLSASSFSVDTSTLQPGKPLLRLKGIKVYDGNTRLTKGEVMNILSFSPVIAKKYEKGIKTKNAGTILLISGLVTFTGGIALMVSGIESTISDDYYYYTYTDYSSNYYIGLAIGVIGELMVDGGIACSIIGKTTVRRSIFNYNEKRNSTGYLPVKINYQLGLLDNGKIGVKLTF